MRERENVESGFLYGKRFGGNHRDSKYSLCDAFGHQLLDAVTPDWHLRWIFSDSQWVCAPRTSIIKYRSRRQKLLLLPPPNFRGRVPVDRPPPQLRFIPDSTTIHTKSLRSNLRLSRYCIHPAGRPQRRWLPGRTVGCDEVMCQVIKLIHELE